MDIKQKFKSKELCDVIAFFTAVAVCAVAFVNVVLYAALGEPVSFVNMLIVNLLFALVSVFAFAARLPIAFIAVGAFGIVAFCCSTNAETSMFNAGFIVIAAAAVIGGIASCVFEFVKRLPPRFFRKLPVVLLSVAATIALVSGVVWSAYAGAAKGSDGKARSELWAVPTVYDSVECPQKGTLEILSYRTKAYATDKRDVEKRACVYLPYGYSEEKQYDVLYLLHGTGDDETYWLDKYDYNKTMVDNLIYHGDIAPLIIVTPTFYVEDDCKDESLDPLTYSFKDELRNDLMPAAESKYSTYANTIDDAGFKTSRNHRAFAGLSRGAVTTLHSVFCGSLDYFSRFGTFSASRTPLEYYKTANFAEDTKELTIDYWYVASGAFDFGLESQRRDWDAITAADERLVIGKNTSFDVYPMRYHSMGNWHLALYNFLQKIF